MYPPLRVEGFVESWVQKKFSGTFGNAGVYSYYSTKAIFAGEGGIVVTNDNNIGKLMKENR